ncbi:glutathione S-transferase family protein [Rhodovibrio salinarum]|uniref:Glutathione S-transferase family protein n=1 Tax=Rhodovibrio salinarum TaxID=1087 RepID=A0A934QL97_9PROT|nr:glutathione S-transferase family protein [Rhodovibrio salinarum]MBK1698794.1 glutathione S-transferase family protein [Rhodovibrio salinarum]
MYRLFADPTSGNCYKVALILHLTGQEAQIVRTSVIEGHTQDPRFRALNPDGRVPFLQFPDGRAMGESNALLLSLARGTAYRPADPVEEDALLAWLFFEQYSFEPNIATARVWRHFTGVPEGHAEVLAAKMANGAHALKVLDQALETRAFLAGQHFTVADIALYAYAHLAGEGGFDLNDYPAVRAWLARVSDQPGFLDMPALFANAPTVDFDDALAAA